MPSETGSDCICQAMVKPEFCGIRVFYWNHIPCKPLLSGEVPEPVEGGEVLQFAKQYIIYEVTSYFQKEIHHCTEVNCVLG